MEELLARGPEDVTVRAIRASAWIEVVESPYPSEALLAWDLGRGETSVLAQARSVESAVVVVDDLQARRAAYSLALPLRGTLGTVLLAKKRGIIDRARPLLVQMKARGMFLSDAVLNLALREVGE